MDEAAIRHVARTQERSPVIAAARSSGYAYHEMLRAVREMFDSFVPRLDELVRPGDHVFVKPFLTQMGSSDYATRRVSHPAFIQCVIEAVRDCGGRVSFGDVGLGPRGTPVAADKRWLFELAQATGAKPISFARAGATRVKSGLPYPRFHYISNAVMDADVVVNCANALPQDKLLITGAIKNMFNTLVGRHQSLIYQMFADPTGLARAIVDVFRIVCPAINLLDMTTVMEPGRHGRVRNVGLILGGRDAVALDALAASVLGYPAQELRTSLIGNELGLGRSDVAGVNVVGAAVGEHVLADFPLPLLHPSGSSSTFGTTTKLLKHAFLQAKPAIEPHLCNGCGDCKDVCPVGAIELAATKEWQIDPSVCINCGQCAAVCDSHAIYERPVGMSRVWKMAKAGLTIGVGPVKVDVRASRRVPVGGAVPGHPTYAQNHPVILAERDRASETTGHHGSRETAVIVGAGPGLGSAMARCFAKEGMNVAMAARNSAALGDVVRDIAELGVGVCAYGCDATAERSVSRLFSSVRGDFGTPALVVYNVEQFVPGSILDTELPGFEDCWRAMCLGGFLVGRDAARLMVAAGRGTIIYTGATASLRGRDGYLNLAVGKFGVRALAQVMARELGPKGVHVAHVVIDGGILSPNSPRDAHPNMSSLFPEEIAKSIVNLHKQHASAWTQELDLRPWIEKF
jgi:uncharacterized protein (DUF362 family)/NAD(P)-dependent dehydrogenase (short-subunit alcohol dehydrogenase family)/Pyruvate/2-oxoacid:ferredoxin oxidoreductase delta subunit